MSAASAGTDELVEEIRQQLARGLAPLGRLGEISLACPSKPVADDPLKLLVRLADGRAAAVVKCSSPIAPDAIAKEMEIADHARELVGDELGQAILRPLLIGEAGGRTFAALPYCDCLSKNRLVWAIQRWRIGKQVLDWLFLSTCASIRPVDDEGIDRDFRRPLASLCANGLLSSRVRDAGCRAAEQLDRGSWRPKYVLAHNDFWKGNILLRRGAPAGLPACGRFSRLAIIDWGGARLQGHAIYDVVIMGRSLALSTRQLRRELRRYCEALDTTLEGVKAYLAAALGQLGLHLNYFPPDRYVALVEACYQTVFSIGEL